MIIFYDTETSGLPIRGLPMDDNAQPWIMQVGAMFTDMDGLRIHGAVSTYIKPDGRKGREGAEAIHGITERDCSRLGVPELGPLSMLTAWMGMARLVVGFGLKFDQMITAGVIERRGKNVSAWERPGVKWIDLIETCAQVCKIPSEHESGTYRWPNLDTACEMILGEAPREGYHDAFGDADRARRLYIELKRRGYLSFGD